MGAHELPYEWSQADWEIPDPGASGVIPGDRVGIVHLVSAGAEARTLAAPSKSGIELQLVGKTILGTVTITIGSSGSYTELSDTTLTIAEAGEFHILRSYEIAANTFAWRLVASDPRERIEVATVTATAVVATTGNITTLTSGPVATATAGITVTDDTGGSGTAAYASVGPAAAAVTQQTNITTAVTIDSSVGKITTVSSTIAAAGREEFGLTNASIANGDVVLCTADTTGTGTPVAYASKTANGSCIIVLENKHASAALNAAVVISFIVHKVTISV